VSKAALEVLGARGLRASLKAAGLSVQDLKDSHAKVAKLVLDESKPGTPVKTGRMKRSGRSSGTQTAAIVRFGGAAVPYAGPVHWGWPARHIKAQPWAWEEAQQSEPQWLPIYMHDLEGIVSKIEGVSYP
jgi:hypothetical protein